MTDERIASLSLEEKVSLLVGRDFWRTTAIEGADIRSILVSDGPHGLRTQAEGGDALGLGTSVLATCFPPAVALASTWNPALVERVGAALGDEARAEGVSVLLGPGVNIKRSPLCGRNFEYFSEDPLLSGELGVAYADGLQSRGVGASVKHFAANNQETGRMSVNAVVDERTLREIYLPAFEAVVKRSRPWTVMCSYNRLNGLFAAENPWLLTTVLREEWGFDGIVVSDWGAVDDRVAALAAGLDLEMPGPQPENDLALAAAVRSRHLAESVVDEAADRIVRLVDRATTGRRGETRPVFADLIEPHHDLAREAAAESIVLLRNEGGVLPLRVGQSIAVIGEFARTPRFQGAGSSQVNPTRVDDALDAILARGAATFAAGYRLDGASTPGLREEAVAAARAAEVALLFVGLPGGAESEGYDRDHLRLPRDQELLIAEVAAANPRTVVVLTNGGVVSLEGWHDAVAGILETWLLGQAGGSAVADVLFGDVNPSGRLTETIPLRLEDTPAFLNFPGEAGVVRYGEGIFVGYRHYETVGRAVRYPFGFGLSYTTFDHSRLVAHRDHVEVTVTNTGAVAGQHVVQVYVSSPVVPVRTPLRELRAFAKVALAPGESTRVRMPLPERAYSYYDVETAAWQVGGGDYVVEVGRSSSDIVLRATVSVGGSRPAAPLGMESSVEEWLAHPVTGPIFRGAARKQAGGGELVEGGASLFDMVGSMPMRRLARFPGTGIDPRQLRMLARVANNPLVRAVATFFGRRSGRGIA